MTPDPESVGNMTLIKNSWTATVDAKRAEKDKTQLHTLKLYAAFEKIMQQTVSMRPSITVQAHLFILWIRTVDAAELA